MACPPHPPAQQDNPLLAFLRPEHTLHRYFEYVLQRVKKGLPVGAWWNVPRGRGRIVLSRHCRCSRVFDLTLAAVVEGWLF
jgi:hypothetical protein